MKNLQKLLIQLKDTQKMFSKLLMLKIIDKLRNSAITEENMVYFLGVLEQKGIDAISEYARLIAEQLKLEKGDVPGVQQQIDDLNNIIAYENANIMNYCSSANQNKQDCPGNFLGFLNICKVDILKPEDEETNNFLSQEELRKAALETLNKKFLGGNNGEKKTGSQLKSSKIPKDRKSIRKQQ